MKKHLFILILLPIFALPGCEKAEDINFNPAPAEEETEAPAVIAPSADSKNGIKEEEKISLPSHPLPAPSYLAAEGENKNLTLPAASPSAIVPPSAPAEEPSVFDFVLGQNLYQTPTLAMPAKNAPIFEPTFNTKIVRATDRKIDGYSDAGIENEYSRTDPENSDETYYILRGNYGNWYLYRRRDNKLIKKLEIVGGGQEPEPRWDAQNPNIFYYLYATELRSYNIETDVSAKIHDFNFPNIAYVTTRTEGDASLDRRYWCILLQDADYNTKKIITYDKITDKIIGQKTDFLGDVDWASMDMSGNYCVIGYGSRNAQIFSRNLSTMKDLPAGASGHMDLALDANGRDVVVYQNNATDFIAMADLETGRETPLVFIPFNVNADIGLHFSGNNAKIPGWALVSTYGSQNPPEGETHSWMDNQLFMVELRAEPRVWRLAMTRAYLSRNPATEKNYFAESFATVNTAGTRIYFGSNWGDFSPDYTETYIINLPAGWQNNIK